jgi:hypothetical protein
VLASCGQSTTAPTPPAPSIVSLTGTVTARGGATLSGAIVRIDDGPNAGKSATTTDSGEYRFEGLAAGNRNVSAVAEGYQSMTTGLYIDGRTPLNFSLLTTEPWSKSGIGDAVFYMPSYITRVHIVGTYTGVLASFMVHVGECAIVEDGIGTGAFRTRSEGTYLLIPAGNPGPRTDADGRVEIFNSQGVSWSFTEDRNSNVNTPCYLY